MKPQVGEPSEEYRAVCVYAPRPGQAQCGRLARFHVMVEDDHYGKVALASCKEHAEIARASGVFVMEHAYQEFCGFPGTLWDEVANRCVLDDSGQELVSKTTSERRTSLLTSPSCA